MSSVCVVACMHVYVCVCVVERNCLFVPVTSLLFHRSAGISPELMNPGKFATLMVLFVDHGHQKNLNECTSTTILPDST